MGKIIDVNRKRNKRGRRSHTIRPPVKLGVTSVGFITVLIICFLALLYLIQANRTATYGFRIEEYDNLISNLRKEKSELELEAAKASSMPASAVWDTGEYLLFCFHLRILFLETCCFVLGYVHPDK